MFKKGQKIGKLHGQIDEFKEIIKPKDLDHNREGLKTFLREEVDLTERKLSETGKKPTFSDITFVQSQKINAIFDSIFRRRTKLKLRSILSKKFVVVSKLDVAFSACSLK